MQRKILILTATCAAVSCFPANAATNIIDDTYGVGAGSFELGAFSPNGGYFMRLNSGSSAMTGWIAGGASGVDWGRSPFPTTDGTFSIDLAGNSGNPSEGSISTVIPTIIGSEYLISFSACVTPSEFTVNGASGILTIGSFSTSFNPPLSSSAANPDWVVYSYAFTASDASTTITFATGPDAFGFSPVIDEVSVILVPEPSSLVLGTSFVMLAGLRRRR